MENKTGKQRIRGTNGSISIQRMSHFLFVVLLAVTLLLGCYSVISVNMAYSVERLQTQEQFEARMQGLENELVSTENYMNNLLMQSDAVHQLNSVGSEFSHYNNRWEIYQNFATYLTQNPNVTLLALYCENTGAYVERDNLRGQTDQTERLELRDRMKTEFIQRCAEGNDLPAWQAMIVDGKLFLYRIVNFKNAYVLGCMDLVSLADSDRLGLLEDERILLRYEGELYPENEELQKFLTSDPSGQNLGIFGERRNVSSQDFHGVECFYLSNGNPALRRGVVFTVLLAVLAISVVVVGMACYFQWKKHVLKPLEVLKQTMADIRNGNLQSRVSDPNAGSELREVNATFNQMMEELRTLKITAYEKELQNRQTQLEYYRLQIRPHFYLNCMKNMYALAANGADSRMQEYILLVSNYLRHSMQKTDSAVSLGEEIAQCGNYVSLIGASASCPPELECSIDERVQELMVPAVSVLTLVENSLKHGGTPSPCLRIEIVAKEIIVDQEPCLHLRVRDNGHGFSEEMLHRLNQMDWNEDTGEHIGLKNVLRRFQLMYSGQTHILFDNEKGACVELFVPITTRIERKGGSK